MTPLIFKRTIIGVLIFTVVGIVTMDWVCPGGSSCIIDFTSDGVILLFLRKFVASVFLPRFNLAILHQQCDSRDYCVVAATAMTGKLKRGLSQLVSVCGCQVLSCEAHMSPKLRRTRHDDEAALDVTQVTVFE
jgi:hypothetical protein